MAQNKKIKAKESKRFVVALSVVSIIGFLSIISSSLFYVDISEYMDFLWLVVLGGGLILEASFKELRMIKKKGLDSSRLGKLTMFVVGALAIIAGLLSIPQINVQNPSFLAVKGIISILAIILIVIETWIID